MGTKQSATTSKFGLFLYPVAMMVHHTNYRLLILAERSSGIYSDSLDCLSGMKLLGNMMSVHNIVLQMLV